jgi:HEPN domain-containing protein
MRKTKSDLVRGWLEKARRDLVIAEKELASASPFTDIVCFHAQQAAEKYLKAYLVWHGISFPKTHALEDLALLAAQQDADYLTLKDTVVVLTPYAVEARYPEFDEPLLDDAERVVQIALHVQSLVLRKLSDEVL